ncbi:MAG: hypothetical protein HC888_03475 [Candidatus Competibacteraceae bacterium]|nr:hypothetical protein [Candidatus Competibacteraceae bacterium]
MPKPLLFAALTVGFFLLATVLFPFAWSNRVRAFHLSVKYACRRIYSQKGNT